MAREDMQSDAPSLTAKQMFALKTLFHSVLLHPANGRGIVEDLEGSLRGMGMTGSDVANIQKYFEHLGEVVNTPEAFIVW